MQTWRTLQLFAFIFPAFLNGVGWCVEIEPCIPAIKNEPCNITCRVPDFSVAVEFNCNGSSRGLCSLFICPSNMIKEGGDTLHLQIPSISYTTDNCAWTCTHGGTSSAPSNIEIFSGISGTLNLTSQRDAGGVELKATAECLYPSTPTVDVQYRYQSGGQYLSLGQKVNLESTNVPGACGFDIENRTTATSDVSGQLSVLEGKNVFFRMKFLQHFSATPSYSNEVGPFFFEGLTSSSSTISSYMSTTVSEVHVPTPPVTTSSAGLSQEIMIITISCSILALGVLILLIVLVVRQCRQKNGQTPAKSKGNRFATKQGNFSKKDALKSSLKPRKSKFSGKRNTKQESISLDKFEHTQFNNSQAPKDRMYEHYPKTTDYMYWNNSGNQHVFNHSHTQRNMIKYGNQHDRYPKSLSGPTNRMLYQSCYPEHPRHNEGMFQYNRADTLYQEQQMYQMSYVAQYDDDIKIKPENKRFEKRTYERNWDFLY